MKKLFIITNFCLMTLCIVFGSPPKQADLSQPVKGISGTISKDFGKVPLYFIANKGQMDERVSYFARTSKYTLWLTKQGLVFDQRGPTKDSVKRRDVSRFCFLNSNPDPRISPVETTSYRVNYFKGRDRSQWYTQIPTSKAVLYENLYKNIDLKVYGIEKEIEYDWVVKPGGDPGEIRFRCEGVKSCTLDEKGDLIVDTALGELIHKRPSGYQVKEGQKHPVEITFSKLKGLKNTFRFQVGAYDKNYPLVIDPMVIAYTSYLGGNNEDSIMGIAVDGSGSVIVAGITMSSDFPVLNGLNETRAGYCDGFVTKFSPNGTSLVFSTFVGGSSGDGINSIDLDATGIYIGGSTGSSDFPTLNAFQDTFQGVYGGDGFVCKLSTDGSGLIYSSFLGGTSVDVVDEIAVNTSGELYALGSTESSDFPLQNPIDSTLSGYDDLFIAKFSSSGSSLVYSTFLGGSDFEQPGGLAIDNSGCAYVTGMTPSTDFPTVNAFQSTNAGQDEGFLSKISADGSSFVYSTYLGGNASDWLLDIKVDTTGAAYVTGASESSNYPTTPSAYQPTLLSSHAAVITKLSPSGSSLVFSTFLAGSSGAAASELALYNGSVYIAGDTSSYDFPLVDPFKDSFCCASGVFIAQLSPDGSTLDFSSFVSNSEYCSTADIAVDGCGNLYMAGSTSDFFPAYQGFQNTFGGGSYDGFVTKLIPSQYSRITVTSPNGGEYWIMNSTQDITWTAPDIMENVKITLYYYDDYDQYLITVAESAPNTGSYTWTVPNISSDSCFINIEDPTFHISPDWSDDSFTISSPPAITVLLPNGGEEWYPGTENPILWATEGIIKSVSIDYSIDGGNSWIPIAENVPYNDYFWTIPDTPSTNCLVRVTEPGLSVTDTSDAVFTIVDSRTITVTSPNGGENWEGGTAQNVTWTSTGIIANVKIEYSTNNGSSWNTITASTANSGTFNWTVPNTPSSTCLVRVSDIASPVTDSSDAAFTILSLRTITVTAPNGGENWIPYSTYAITWTFTGNVINVSIDYSTDSGNSWTPVAASITNTGSFNWTIPDTPSTNCLVKVSDAGGTAADLSNAVFTITTARISEAQRNFLIELFNYTNGHNWTRNDNWLKSEIEFNDPGTEHTWYGVTLSANHTYIESLNLSYNNLVGIIPDTSALVNLKYLNLSVNDIGGAIPPGISALTQLTTLILHSNRLNGVPPDLSPLTNLEYLNLSGNDFSGSIPQWLNQLTSLKSLLLSYIDWTSGTFPDLSNLVNLEQLVLNEVNLTGSIPTYINNLTNLKRLNLETNQLSGNIPDLTNLTNLEELSLKGNSLTGVIPAWLNNLTKLISLNLGFNQLSGNITDLSSLTNLEELLLDDNSFIGNIPVWLNNLTNLHDIRLGNNDLTGEIPYLSDLIHMIHLDLSGNQLSGSVPSWLNNFTGLFRLHLHNNNLSGQIPDLNLPQLFFLTLSNNQLTGNCPYLSGCSNLYSLNISNNQLVGELPLGLGSLSNLHDLFLQNNHFTGPLPQEICNLSNLEELDLSGNKLAGILPSTITNMGVPYIKINIHWNGLYTNDSQVKNFVDSHHILVWLNDQWVNWTYTQTVAPTDVSSGDTDHDSVMISWDPILYQAETGGYRVYSTMTSGSNYTLAGATADKSVNQLTVTGLDPGTMYYFVVETFTNPHEFNNNTVVSEYSEEVSTTTQETPTITVTSPNGGESWEGGTNQDITWTSTGNITDVKIEYSTDNGTIWNTIVGTTPNNGSYNWTIPNTPSTVCLVKISEITDIAADTSDAVFTIAEQRTVTLTAPNGSENWEGGTARDITWTSTGSIANVKLEYSTDNGSSWTIIAASTANSGTFNWTVSNTPSTTCLVKISDTSGPAVDTSDAVFTIAAQRTITVTTPNGGENWEGTTSHNITWTSTGSIPAVKLEYSPDNGGNWNTVTASTANNGTHNWTVPNTPSTNCLIKISDTAGPASDTSDAVFTIAAQRTITVTSPNGGENWEGTTSNDINWTSTGSIADVKLEYSTNNGSSWNTITASTANNGTYNWTVPNTPSTSCLVKVSDTAGPAADTSDAVFTIAAQRTITVIAPNGGENWEGTTTQNITWASTGSIANVMIEYSTNNGSSWNTITASTANSGTYNWTVPNTPSTSCLVKVSDTAGPAADTSDTVFTIAAQRTLTVIAPNGGENWEGTTSQNITWTSTGSIANVMIEYSTNNGSSWNTITASTANSGTYNWTVPNNPSTNCLVKISDTAGPAFDTSNGVFTIAELRTVTVTSPNGSERWFIDSSYPVTWQTTGNIPNVMIEYSTNNGSSWNTVVSSTGNSGIYNWTIPNNPSANCLVRVSDTAGPAADTSNSVFTIDPYPTITVSAPNGGETWEAYTLQTITWSSTGTVTNVSIDYSTNGGSSWNTITTSTPNTGSFNWSIPYIESNNCLVRVSDLATAASDTSDGVFTMILPPSITVTSPNGGESWARRSTQTITWTSTGIVGDVDIRYTMDGGSTWELIVSAVPNTGSCQWSLPNVNKTAIECLVKITAINGSAEDTSDAFFTIIK